METNKINIITVKFNNNLMKEILIIYNEHY